VFQSQPGQIVQETLSQKTHHKTMGLLEWLKVKALSSNPSTAKKKKSKSGTCTQWDIIQAGQGEGKNTTR
jgi:hypothetical protein